MEYIKAHRRSALLFFLFVIAISFWYVALTEDQHGLLTVTVLNVGEGNAIFIEAPNGNKVIINAGPDNTIISELASLLPFYDRSISLAILTNPSAENYSGFFDLLKSFSVGKFLEPGTQADSAIYAGLKEGLSKKNIPDIIAKRGMKIMLDTDVALSVLFPDEDVSKWAGDNGSLVLKLVYGKTSFLFEGDATAEVERHLLSLEDDTFSQTYGGLQSQVIVVAHHGADTGTSPEYVKEVSPKYAVISVGKNQYDYPRKTTLDTLQKFGAKVLRTDENGTIVFQSDGQNIAVK